jgi:hypothetical protein
MPFHSMGRAASAALLGAVLVACASADVQMTRRAPPALAKPDSVQVRNFAVTLADVALDSGIGPSVTRAAMGEADSADEQKIGRAASNALAEELVKKLDEYGIDAARGAHDAPITPTTLVIVGRFVSVDEGNRTMRTLIGFGAGASEVRTQARAYMGGQLMASAETIAKGNKKPGAAVTLGAGAAAGAAASAAAMAVGTTVASELLGSAESDARRTGAALADQIREVYVSRGWLAN